MSKIQLKNWEYDKDCPETMHIILCSWHLLSSPTDFVDSSHIEQAWKDRLIALSIPYSSELELMYEKEKRGEL